MKIAVLGAGAMGSIYGAYLSKRNDVTMYDALERRVAQIDSEGIVLQTPDGTRTSYAVKSRQSGAGGNTVDLLLVFVKGMYTYEAVMQNAALIAPETRILSLQNGYGNHLEILRAVPDARVLLGVTMHGGTMRSDGSVLHAAHGVTELGALNEADSDYAARLADALDACGLEARLSENTMQTIWRKLIVNAGINGVAALLNVRNRFFMKDAYAMDALRSIVAEATAIANRVGCDFDEGQMRDLVMETTVVTGANRASMLQDMLALRPTEADYIYGAIVRSAQDAGMEAPICALMLSLLHAREHALREAEDETQDI